MLKWVIRFVKDVFSVHEYIWLNTESKCISSYSVSPTQNIPTFANASLMGPKYTKATLFY